METSESSGPTGSVSHGLLARIHKFHHNESSPLPAQRPRAHSVDFITERVYPSPNASQPSILSEESARAIQKRKEVDRKLQEWGAFLHGKPSSTLASTAEAETEDEEAPADANSAELPSGTAVIEIIVDREPDKFDETAYFLATPSSDPSPSPNPSPSLTASDESPAKPTHVSDSEEGGEV